MSDVLYMLGEIIEICVHRSKELKDLSCESKDMAPQNWRCLD